MSVGNIGVNDANYQYLVRFWSGSDVNGALDSSNNCTNFTEGGSGDSSYGDASSYISDLTYLKKSTFACTNKLRLLCICY